MLNSETKRAIELPLEDRIGEIVDLFSERLTTGEISSVESFLGQYPEHSELLRPLLNALFEIEQGSIGETVLGASKERRLGDYRIIREIGRGGMGVVYQAEQVSLGREVALKVLPFASMIDAKPLERFRNEVRAAASLEHPHIVSVYAVGEERGVHFYAMQLIRGQSLAAVIQELQQLRQADGQLSGSSISEVMARSGDHSRDEVKCVFDSTTRDDFPHGSQDAIELASQETHAIRGQATTDAAVKSSTDRNYYCNVARLGIQAADALAHAHEQGVIHRDIKPGNLMLDSQGQLFVTDFGLARIEAAGVTMTGDWLGTPRYMSPEQAMGTSIVIDHRADIFSLGVTIYELMTLTPVFGGNDRQTLLKQIANDEPPKPRSLDSRIPRDLETIVLKAISKDRDERFDTASDLAEDLQCFLDDKPIQAKPPTLLQRGTKWSVRHKPLVATLAVAMLLAVIGLTVSNLLIAGQRNIAQQQRDEAQRQKRRADENFRRAQEAVDKYLTKVGEEVLLDAPGMQLLRRELLELALEYYMKFIEEREDDPELRLELALSYRRAADISAEENITNAAELARKSVTLLEQLVAENPNSGKYHYELASSILSLAGKDPWGPETQQNLDRSTSIAINWKDRGPYRLEFCKLLARCFHLQAWKYKNVDRDFDRAISYSKRAIDLGEVLIAENPDSSKLLNDLSSAYGNLGFLLWQTRRIEESSTACRKALDLGRKVARLNPDSLQNQHSLACALTNYAVQHLPSDARELVTEAIQIQSLLAKENPSVFNYRNTLCKLHINMAEVHKQNGDRIAEIDSLQTALEIRKSLLGLTQKPESSQYNLIQIYNEMHLAHLAIGELDEAYDASMHSVEIADAIADKVERNGIVGAYLNHGWFLFNTRDKYEDAIPWWNKARNARLRISSVRPSEFDRYLLSLYPFRFGRADLALGQNEKALESFQECLSVLRELIAEDPGQTNVQVTMARSFAQLGDAYIGVGLDQSARESYESAIKKWEELAGPECNDASVLARFAILLADCAIIELRDPARALKLAKAAQDLLTEGSDPIERRIVNQALGITFYRTSRFLESIEFWNEYSKSKEHAERLFFLSMAQFKTGKEYEARTNFEKGVEWMAEHKNQHPSLLRLQNEAADLIEEKNPNSK